MKNVKIEPENILEAIEKERRKDQLIRRMNRVGWIVTLSVLLVFLVFTIRDFAQTYQNYIKGRVLMDNVIETLMPFLVTLGILGFTVAILSTVGMFLRLRTTSLLDMQQRLANLEKMLSSQ